MPRHSENVCLRASRGMYDDFNLVAGHEPNLEMGSHLQLWWGWTLLAVDVQLPDGTGRHGAVMLPLSGRTSNE